jgi:hypothetical protein
MSDDLPLALPGVSARRRKLVDLMISEGLRRDDAAKRLGMSTRGARLAWSSLAVRSYFQRERRALRESEIPRSIHKLAELRDSARSEKVSLDAAKTLATEERSGPSNVINIGIGVNTPGYIVDLGLGGRTDELRDVLRQAGSTRNLLIEHEPGESA